MPRLSLGLGVQNIRKVGGGAAPSSLLSGLFAYWNLNTDSWLDSTDGYPLIYSGTQVSTATGKIGNSASFNGSNYLYIDEFNITTNCSFSFWFKSSVTSGVDLGVGVVDVDGQSFVGGFRILSINGVIYFQAPSQVVVVNSVDPYCDGTFHHAVGTSDGYTIKIYIDGNLKQQNTANLGVVLVNYMAIGSYGDGLAQSGTQIDEVGVWDRALSQSEITSLYNAGAGKTYPFN
jgi:hypothetical protein